MVTVPKPTQVGVKNILRRARERSLRNSANYARNFGKRAAAVRDLLRVGCGRRSKRNGPGDCLTKTQHSAKSSKTMYRV